MGKEKGIAGAIGFKCGHPLRASSRNALSVSSVTWFVIFCCGKLIAFLQKNKPSPFVVKNTVLGIFHPHALTALKRSGGGFAQQHCLCLIFIQKRAV